MECGGRGVLAPHVARTDRYVRDNCCANASFSFTLHVSNGMKRDRRVYYGHTVTRSLWKVPDSVGESEGPWRRGGGATPGLTGRDNDCKLLSFRHAHENITKTNYGIDK